MQAGEDDGNASLELGTRCLPTGPPAASSSSLSSVRSLEKQPFCSEETNVIQGRQTLAATGHEPLVHFRIK